MNSEEAKLYSKTRDVQRMSFKLYVQRHLTIDANDRILDVGCGTGDLVYEMGAIAHSVIGHDISKEMIEVARRKYQRENVSYEITDIENCLEKFPTWKGSFNKVVSVHVLHWVKDRKQALRNIYDCLSETGQCFLLVCGPLHQLLGHRKDELPHFLENHIKWKQHLKGYQHKMYNHLTLDENIQLLKLVGFEEVEGFLHTPCSEMDILSKEQLRDYVRTLVGHVKYVPEQYRSEIVADATDWCYENFPVNQRGNRYIGLDIMVFRATKPKWTTHGCEAQQ
ncbi:juvenile hormone acid O-methyltransferase-like [Antedon mediterranea]|uniref:juvenile hormone acid O-methyltransferase-like n=1 Tax=Antedon mediterranea TaxID=105859 RepID=UPI003AF486F9